MKINILVTSSGVMSAVNVIKSLRLQNEYDLNIIAIDMDEYAPGLYLADKKYLCPPVKQSIDYLNFIFEIIQRESIQFVFPCYSGEISLFAKNKKELLKIGANVLLPNVDTIKLCNDKMKSNSRAKEINIPVPEIFANPTESDLPIFTRLVEGSSSDGALLIENELLLNFYLKENYKRIFQQYIDGVEYTVDTICDYNYDVIKACPRIRISTKSGQTVKGITVNDDKIQQYTKAICKAFKIVGVCNLQFMREGNTYYFIEVNPRYAAGGLMLTTNSGVNLPLLALKIMQGITIDQSELNHNSGLKMTRYWQEIIISEPS